MGRMTDEEWAAAHLAETKEMFRKQLLQAISVHIPLEGEPGHLSYDDIAAGLVGATCAVLVLKSASECKAGA